MATVSSIRSEMRGDQAYTMLQVLAHIMAIQVLVHTMAVAIALTTTIRGVMHLRSRLAAVATPVPVGVVLVP